MADDGISIESVEVTLESGIPMSSAVLMKDAYLPPPGENAGEGQRVSPVQPGNLHPEVAPAGPDARIYLTKIVSRTPDDVIERALRNDPGRTIPSGNHDFSTVILTLSIRLGDPLTTHLINGMIEFAVLEDEEILDHSPKDKGSITALIENGGNTLSLSQGLIFFAPEGQDTTVLLNTAKNRFGIPVGQGEKLVGTYSAKNGYSFAIPAAVLLEYQGLLKNRHKVFWEIYPPMPPQDREMAGDAMLAVFSVIIRTPQNSPPKIRATMECRVKGNLWGVIPLKGSVDLP